MDNNLNKKEIERYAAKFSNHILNNIFTSQERVQGDELKTLTPIKQVNLFIIKNLFKAWQDETSQLRSPYFDYGTPAVQEALREFMNTLSNHISIARKDLSPLVEKATYQTILLVLSPYDFYTHFDEIDSGIRTQYLKDVAKYVKINKDLMDEFIAHLSKKDVQVLNREEFTNELNEVFGNTQADPADPKEYMDQFNAVVALRTATFYENNDVRQEQVSVSMDEPATEPTKNDMSANEEEPPVTLNEELTQENRPSLAELHQSKKIESIKSSLTINQRFMFVNTLFDGNQEHFNAAINEFEKMNDTSEALSYIRNNHEDWDMNSEEVEEFMEIVNKRLE